MLHEAQTVRLYENDSYLREFSARVVCCVPAGQIFAAAQQNRPQEAAAAAQRDIAQETATAAQKDMAQEAAAAAQRNIAQGAAAGGGDWAVVLDRTAFFPEGGGQGADTGWLSLSPAAAAAADGKPEARETVAAADGKPEVCGADAAAEGKPEVCGAAAAADGKPEVCGAAVPPVEFAVTDVQIVDGIVYHRTAFWASPGTAVVGKICWEQRFSNMQQHSGEHIFSGLVHRYFGYRNVGFHLGSQTVTMDFNGILSNRELERLEWEANTVIAKNVPVTVSYPDRETLKTLEYRSKIEIEGQVRIVTVQGCDVCACCAPHVAHTGEIGLLKVVDAQKYKGGVRVSILCGFRALSDYREKLAGVHQISQMLSAPPQGVIQAVERERAESARLRQKLYERTQQLIDRVIEAVPEGQDYIWLFEETLDTAAMRRAVNRALKRAGTAAGIFCGSDDAGYNYIIGAIPGVFDATTAAAALKSRLGARGGGRPEMVQGFVRASRPEIETLLDSLSV